MSLKAKSVTFTVVILLALAGLFSGIFVGQHVHFKKRVDVAKFHGTYLENPRPVNQFSLTGIDAKTFDNKSLQGKWTLMFFGFTNCGYVCPTTMAELTKMYRVLEEKKVKNLPHIVMISIDPERDNQEKLRSYVTSFHSSFYGARGDEKSIKLMTREMGIAYAKIVEKENGSSENYDIQHSGALMLFNPQGELNAFFTTPHHADFLAKDYLLLAS
ncbi:MAG: SCO family protein [Legionella sp.]